jgi:hypothetical protein
VKIPGHPATHGYHVNPWTCGSQQHRLCDGFSGGHDTYQCGCCCHDELLDPAVLTADDRTLITRVLGMSGEAS